MSASILEFINGKVDMIGFIIPSAKTKSMPAITFQPSRLAMAGSRIKKLAKTYELNIDDMATSYKNIQLTFTKEK